jgi:AP-2 complex subunit mu-1
VIGAKKTGVPIIYLDKCSFMYSRVGDVYIVAVTKQNANAALVFQFIYKMVDVFRAYFGGAFDEENCRQNFVLIYELLDECCDHGYPQITAINILTSYIQVANVKAQDSVRRTHKHARKGDGDGATESKRRNVGRIVGGALALSIRRAQCRISA